MKDVGARNFPFVTTSHNHALVVMCGVIGGGVVAACLAAASTASRFRRVRGREVGELKALVHQQENELEKRAAIIKSLGEQAKLEAQQRAEERRGRTEAERRLRAEKQGLEETNGYTFTAIGTISTPFRDRRGTPRQGSITPLSRGKIFLDSSVVGYPALIGLTDFSHVWLLFVFHDNTNAVVNGVVDERPVPTISKSEPGVMTAAAVVASPTSAGALNLVNGASALEEALPVVVAGGEGKGSKEPERWGGGVREYQPPRHKLRQTFLTKVCPPRLGKKVGVLGTRSPHRPNPLGLTMVKLDGVDLKTNTITVSGIDLVDGTPIVDVKPVIPHDIPREMLVPEWVEGDLCQRTVVFTEAANLGLDGCVGETARKNKSKFYADTDSFKAAVTEILVQDVRSVHQGRGLASDELYECCFDGVVMHFVTTVEEIHVVSACAA